MDSGGVRLCRDCLRRCSRDSARCARCGSPRTVNLEAAAGLEIAHVDCDAFYASVEKRDDAGLRDKPVIVGGSGPRAVVATCCYIARTFGVRSAMPMSRARALCPNAVVLPPDMARCARIGDEIRARMLELTPLVEPLSIDEAFLDLTGGERCNGASAAETLTRFARRVEGEIGVTLSVGLSYCKFLAKLGLGSRQASRLRIGSATRSENLARAAERRALVGRRQDWSGATGAIGPPSDRRFAKDRRTGGGFTPRR
jgi:DNA polymerase IV